MSAVRQRQKHLDSRDTCDWLPWERGRAQGGTECGVIESYSGGQPKLLWSGKIKKEFLTWCRLDEELKETKAVRKKEHVFFSMLRTDEKQHSSYHVTI